MNKRVSNVEVLDENRINFIDKYLQKSCKRNFRDYQNSCYLRQLFRQINPIAIEYYYVHTSKDFKRTIEILFTLFQDRILTSNATYKKPATRWNLNNVDNTKNDLKLLISILPNRNINFIRQLFKMNDKNFVKTIKNILDFEREALIERIKKINNLTVAKRTNKNYDSTFAPKTNVLTASNDDEMEENTTDSGSDIMETTSETFTDSYPSTESSESAEYISSSEMEDSNVEMDVTYLKTYNYLPEKTYHKNFQSIFQENLNQKFTKRSDQNCGKITSKMGPNINLIQTKSNRNVSLSNNIIQTETKTFDVHSKCPIILKNNLKKRKLLKENISNLRSDLEIDSVYGKRRLVLKNNNLKKYCAEKQCYFEEKAFAQNATKNNQRDITNKVRKRKDFKSKNNLLSKEKESSNDSRKSATKNSKRGVRNRIDNRKNINKRILKKNVVSEPKTINLAHKSVVKNNKRIGANKILNRKYIETKKQLVVKENAISDPKNYGFIQASPNNYTNIINNTKNKIRNRISNIKTVMSALTSKNLSKLTTIHYEKRDILKLIHGESVVDNKLIKNMHYQINKLLRLSFVNNVPLTLYKTIESRPVIQIVESYEVGPSSEYETNLSDCDSDLDSTCETAKENCVPFDSAYLSGNGMESHETDATPVIVSETKNSVALFEKNEFIDVVQYSKEAIQASYLIRDKKIANTTQNHNLTVMSRNVVEKIKTRTLPDKFHNYLPNKQYKKNDNNTTQFICDSEPNHTFLTSDMNIKYCEASVEYHNNVINEHKIRFDNTLALYPVHVTTKSGSNRTSLLKSSNAQKCSEQKNTFVNDTTQCGTRFNNNLTQELENVMQINKTNPTFSFDISLEKCSKQVDYRLNDTTKCRKDYNSTCKPHLNSAFEKNIENEITNPTSMLDRFVMQKCSNNIVSDTVQCKEGYINTDTQILDNVNKKYKPNPTFSIKNSSKYANQMQISNLSINKSSPVIVKHSNCIYYEHDSEVGTYEEFKNGLSQTNDHFEYTTIDEPINEVLQYLNIGYNLSDVDSNTMKESASFFNGAASNLDGLKYNLRTLSPEDAKFWAFCYKYASDALYKAGNHVRKVERSN